MRWVSQPNAAGRPLDKILKDCMFLSEVNLLIQPGSVVKMVLRLQSFRQREGLSVAKTRKDKVKDFHQDATRLGNVAPKLQRESPFALGFNLVKCSEKVERRRCRRSLHVCVAPRCDAHHTII